MSFTAAAAAIRSRAMTVASYPATSMPHRLRMRCPPATRIASVRALHRSAPRSYAAESKEDVQDRTRLNPRSSEYSGTTSDDQVASMQDAAFNPKKTSPEEQVETADRESGEVRQTSSEDPNPLDVSPGNREVSKSKDPKETGSDRSPSEYGGGTRSRTSSHGSPKKHGGDKTG